MNLTNQDIKNLKDKKFRREHGYFLVEGNKFCRDLLATNVEIVYTITTDKSLTGFPHIELVSEKMLASLATTVTNQDVVCVCKKIDYGLESAGNALILDNLQDPGNVGTLIRSALAFGFDDIYLVGGADPYSEKVIRSSAGLVMSARIHEVTYEQIKENKNSIAKKFLIADMNGENINEICLPKEKIAVIIGNKGNGVSQEMKDLADTIISIPMTHKVESLNAGVAGSIIMQRFASI